MILKALINLSDVDKTDIESVLPRGQIQFQETEEAKWIRFELANYDESSITDPAQVSAIWNEARELVATIDSVFAYSGHANQLIEFRNLKWIDSTGEAHWMPIGARIELFASESILKGLVKTGGAERSEDDGARSPMSKLMELSLTEPYVGHVLRLLRLEKNWGNLYKIYEVVRKQVGSQGKLVAKGFAGGSELDAFTASANHPHVSGEGSRHAVPRGGPPKNTMSLARARVFIDELVHTWIDDLSSTT